VVEETWATSNVLRNDSGELLVVHGVIKVVIRDGQPVVDRFTLSLECRGRGS
jgi:hypothetical protein